MKLPSLPKIKYRKYAPPIIGITLIPIIVTGILAYVIYKVMPYLPPEIPLFYNLPWGIDQLAEKDYLWGAIVVNTLIIMINSSIIIILYKNTLFLLSKIMAIATMLIVFLNSYYAFRIISVSTTITLVIPEWIKLTLIPLSLALVTTLIVTPIVIKMAYKFNWIDDPLRHKHPGMLLTKPTPRAGGFAFYLGILIPSILILPITSSQKIAGILIGALINVIVGLVDDRKDVNPYLRLALQVAAVLITVLSGIILIYIPNPFGDAILLDQFKYVFNFIGEHSIYYFSVLAAVIWMLWTMNFMSFANGTDGVYAGLVSISAAVIMILMFQSLNDDPSLDIYIKLAALTAGAGLGMAVYTWPPQKLLWGYGATSAGLIIAALSILGSTKVATTLIVLMIPFLDGAFAVARRLKRGQSPFWGDREHLHHRLLEGLGWSKHKVALFYWCSTLTFAAIGILTKGQTRALSMASLGALVILGIALLNLLKKPEMKQNINKSDE